MRRSISILLWVSLIVCGLCSCAKGGTKAKLQEVESIISEKPDVALDVLERVRQSELNTGGVKARHSLLYVMALDKIHANPADIALIEAADKYYSRFGSPEEKMKTNYYKGLIYQNGKEYTRSLYCFQKALEDSTIIENNYYKALINNAIAITYARTHTPERSLQYAQDAVRYGYLAKDSVQIWSLTGNLADSYTSMGMWDEAEDAYNEYFAMRISDPAKYYMHKIRYSEVLLNQERYLEADSVLKNVIEHMPGAMDVESYCMYAFVQQKTGNEEMADDIMSHLVEVGKDIDIVRYWRYRINSEAKRYECAVEDLEFSVASRDSVISAQLRQSLLKQYGYIKSEFDTIKRENSIQRREIIFMVISGLLLVAIFFLVYRRKKEDAESKMEELSMFQQESQRMLEKANSEIKYLDSKNEFVLSSLQRQFAVLFREHYSKLDELCAAYLSPSKKGNHSQVYETVKRQIEAIAQNDNAQSKFMDMVNESLDHIIDKLRLDLPNHTEQDFLFLTYVIVGFEAKTIASLMGISTNTVYTKKARIKNELIASNSPNMDFYLKCSAL